MECFFPRHDQDPRQVPSLQFRSDFHVLNHVPDSSPRESARIEAELFTDGGNYAVARMPGRRFPRVAM
ncbi:DUF6959 family protein [Streptomyces sp. NPDC101133]|uniref:DUF6959 family protein n=1 Tax=Streptomyces sp. NPDC101133 TaxID=3366111 RepID=UPI003811DF6E